MIIHQLCGQSILLEHSACMNLHNEKLLSVKVLPQDTDTLRRVIYRLPPFCSQDGSDSFPLKPNLKNANLTKHERALK